MMGHKHHILVHASVATWRVVATSGSSARGGAACAPRPQPKRRVSFRACPLLVHNTGADGDRMDFKGADNTVYAMHSSRSLALNALYRADTKCHTQPSLHSMPCVAQS